MKKAATIHKDQELPAGLDFARLRAEGVAYLQQLSGHRWTDYNEHDPGVTILETLCYALTDLVNRASLPIPDLLAPAPDSKRRAGSTLAPAHVAFSNHPITLHDYKKIVLDQLGDRLKNVWLERRRPGQVDSRLGEYTVRIEMPQAHARHEAYGTHDSGLTAAQERRLREEIDLEVREQRRAEMLAEARQQLAADVLRLLNQHRNLGEEFTKVVFLKSRPLIIGGAIEIKPGYLPEDVVANLLWQVNGYFDPYMSIMGLKDLQAAGVPTEDIFAGPLLSHRLLQEKEFKKLRRMILPAKLNKQLLQVNGIRAVRELNLYEPGLMQPSAYVRLRRNEAPELDAEISLQRLVITFQGISMEFDRDRALRKYLQLHHANDQNLKSKIPTAKLRFPEPEGHYHNLSHFDSIQHDFPPVYGLGPDGPPVGASPARRANTLQLKGYLVLFEQLMANFCAQVAKTAELFSPLPQHHTHFAAPLYDVPHLEHVLADFGPQKRYNPDLRPRPAPEWEEFRQNEHNAYRQHLRELAEHSTEFLERRNRILTHLLARFGYNIAAYEPTSTDPQSIREYGIEVRERLLRNLHVATYHRSAARLNPQFVGLGNQTGVSGLEFMLYLLTGIGYYQVKAAHHQRLAELAERVQFVAAGTGADAETLAGVELRVHGGQFSGFPSFLRLLYQQLNVPSLQPADPDDNFVVRVPTATGGPAVRLELVGRGRRNLFQQPKGAPPVPEPGPVKRVLQYLQQLDEQLERFVLIDHRTLQMRWDLDREADNDDELEEVHQVIEPEFYQYQLTLFFPAFTQRFRQMARARGGGMTYSYQEFIQFLVQRYAPAHLLVNVVWLDYEQLVELEEIYPPFVEASGLLNNSGQHNAHQLRPLQRRLRRFVRQQLIRSSF